MGLSPGIVGFDFGHRNAVSRPSRAKSAVVFDAPIFAGGRAAVKSSMVKENLPEANACGALPDAEHAQLKSDLSRQLSTVDSSPARQLETVASCGQHPTHLAK